MALLYLQADTGNPRHRVASENSIASAPSTKPHWTQGLSLLAWV